MGPVVALPQALAQKPAGVCGGLHHRWLAADIRNHLGGDPDALAVEHAGQPHLAGLAEAAAETGGGALTGDLGHGFDEIVEKKFLDLIGGHLAAAAADPHRDPQLAPEGVALLMTKLEPAFQKGMGLGVDA